MLTSFSAWRTAGSIQPFRCQPRHKQSGVGTRFEEPAMRRTAGRRPGIHRLAACDAEFRHAREAGESAVRVGQARSPKSFMYNRQFEQPKADKESWQQTARYDWSGGRRRRRFASPCCATRPRRRSIRSRGPSPSRRSRLASRTAWEFDGGKLVVDLGKDRMMILDALTWKQTQTNLAKFAEQFALDNMRPRCSTIRRAPTSASRSRCFAR